MKLKREPLTRCPSCRYSLHGLPVAHRCPECGFQYDEATQVWWVPVIPVWSAMLFGFAIDLLAEMVIANKLRVWFGLKATAVSALLVSVAFVVPLVVRSGIRGFISAGRTGLAFRFPLGRLRSMSWSEVRVSPSSIHVTRLVNGSPQWMILPTIGVGRHRRIAINREIARLAEEWKVSKESDVTRSDSQTG